MYCRDCRWWRFAALEHPTGGECLHPTTAQAMRFGCPYDYVCRNFAPEDVEA
jgi:hypothetical protein